MNSPVATEKPQNLPENQRTALIKLLSDEDPSVYHLVREKILSYGQIASAWMRPHVLSSDPVLRRRAQEIIDYLARQSADNRFLAFCLSQHGEDLDVSRGRGCSLKRGIRTSTSRPIKPCSTVTPAT